MTKKALENSGHNNEPLVTVPQVHSASAEEIFSQLVVLFAYWEEHNFQTIRLPCIHFIVIRLMLRSLVSSKFT